MPAWRAATWACGPVLSRSGGQDGGLETHLDDVGDADEPEPVGEEGGVEVPHGGLLIAVSSRTGWAAAACPCGDA